jgi:peptidoglycan/LPS O-acetylase OafA/YrhL
MTLATVPLLAICVGLFLPTTLHNRSPLDEIRSDNFFRVLVGPSFGLAFVFVVVLLRATARRVPRRSTRLTVTAAFAVYAIAMALYLSLSEQIRQLAFLLVPVVGGAFLLIGAVAARGWRRWTFMLASYVALSAIAEMYVMFEVRSVCGIVCLPAYAALLVLCVVGTWPTAGRRAVETSQS